MKKRILLIGGIVVLVLLLAGAAFVGGQLVNGQGLPGLGAMGGLNMFMSQGGGPGQSVQFEMIPAKELPQMQPDASGIFDHRKDSSIFVGTGVVRSTVHKDVQTGKVEASSSHSGPTVEVVVTPQTIVYRDVTMKQVNGQPPGGKIQQVIEPGAQDEIGENSMVTAWGKKTGDRIIADVLVYTPPPVLGKP